MKLLNAIITILTISLLAGCPSSKETTKSSLSDEYDKYRLTPLGVKYFDIKPGTGPEAVIGKKVTLDYVGTLQDGTIFEDSYQQKKPISFTLGSEEILKGWNEGILGMRVGGKRKLVIPPELGYGNRAVGGKIPANSTLYFVVELINVE